MSRRRRHKQAPKLIKRKKKTSRTLKVHAIDASEKRAGHKDGGHHCEHVQHPIHFMVLIHVYARGGGGVCEKDERHKRHRQETSIDALESSCIETHNSRYVSINSIDALSRF